MCIRYVLDGVVAYCHSSAGVVVLWVGKHDLTVVDDGVLQLGHGHHLQQQPELYPFIVKQYLREWGECFLILLHSSGEHVVDHREQAILVRRDAGHQVFNWTILFYA